VQPKIRVHKNHKKKKISEKHLRSIHQNQLSISQLNVTSQIKKQKAQL
jgi:hypothetical protein